MLIIVDERIAVEAGNGVAVGRVTGGRQGAEHSGAGGIGVVFAAVVDDLQTVADGVARLNGVYGRLDLLADVFERLVQIDVNRVGRVGGDGDGQVAVKIMVAVAALGHLTGLNGNAVVGVLVFHSRNGRDREIFVRVIADFEGVLLGERPDSHDRQRTVGQLAFPRMEHVFVCGRAVQHAALFRDERPCSLGGVAVALIKGLVVGVAFHIGVLLDEDVAILSVVVGIAVALVGNKADALPSAAAVAVGDNAVSVGARIDLIAAECAVEGERCVFERIERFALLVYRCGLHIPARGAAVVIALICTGKDDLLGRLVLVDVYGGLALGQNGVVHRSGELRLNVAAELRVVSGLRGDGERPGRACLERVERQGNGLGVLIDRSALRRDAGYRAGQLNGDGDVLRRDLIAVGDGQRVAHRQTGGSVRLRVIGVCLLCVERGLVRCERDRQIFCDDCGRFFHAERLVILSIAVRADKVQRAFAVVRDCGQCALAEALVSLRAVDLAVLAVRAVRIDRNGALAAAGLALLGLRVGDFAGAAAGLAGHGIKFVTAVAVWIIRAALFVADRTWMIKVPGLIFAFAVTVRACDHRDLRNNALTGRAGLLDLYRVRAAAGRAVYLIMFMDDRSTLGGGFRIVRRKRGCGECRHCDIARQYERQSSMQSACHFASPFHKKSGPPWDGQRLVISF